MEKVDPNAFQSAIQKIDDGFLFEKFSQAFLAEILGHTFNPYGGLKDKGIDGIDYVFSQKVNEKIIYQASIDKNSTQKLRSTLMKLENNKINYEQLVFVTNQVYKDLEKSLEELINLYKKPVRIYDARWFETRINHSDGTIRAYHIYVLANLHELQKPGVAFEVRDIKQDPQIFVFLRQQFEAHGYKSDMENVLVDSLILYVLEDTDPKEGRFKSSGEIKEDIEKIIQFDLRAVMSKVDERLSVLSSKPRRINWHSSENGYCLPYETRLEIMERNLEDGELQEKFDKSLNERITKLLREEKVRVNDVPDLVRKTIHSLFYRQGLDFANFILENKNDDVAVLNLSNVVREIVDNSKVVDHNKELVKNILHNVIRNVAYDGTDIEKNYLKRLSNTYMMLFMLQCDPSVTKFFNVMASKLRIFVGTSILIPAMSERFLEDKNRRYWNLLKGAANAGVELIVNDTIIEELASHFRRAVRIYQEEFERYEGIYINEEIEVIYIKEIFIRAYFYSKFRGKVETFSGFIDRFVDPDLASLKEDLITFLEETFSIRYVTDSSLQVSIDAYDYRALFDKLKVEKKSNKKAESDAKLFLTIFGLRERDNEVSQGEAGISGYRTWWLSTDTKTLKAINGLLSKEYETTCYIRPDFLANYVVLSPKVEQVNNTFDALFPSLVGVNLGYHLPPESLRSINEKIQTYRDIDNVRLKATMKRYSNRLKSDANLRTPQGITSFFDNEMKEEFLELPTKASN
jgi:hypothetical protein